MYLLNAIKVMPFLSYPETILLQGLFFCQIKYPSSQKNRNKNLNNKTNYLFEKQLLAIRFIDFLYLYITNWIGGLFRTLSSINNEAFRGNS